MSEDWKGTLIDRLPGVPLSGIRLFQGMKR
jgi:hypothetical protein